MNDNRDFIMDYVLNLVCGKRVWGVRTKGSGENASGTEDTRIHTESRHIYEKTESYNEPSAKDAKDAANLIHRI